MSLLFPLGVEVLNESADVEHDFRIEGSGRKFRILKDGEELELADASSISERLDSHVRLTVADFAKNFVFVHAGVVAWRGRAIVIPASSFAGKTTLVAELIKRGAEYYSDEYAVFDKFGAVHPYPKALSMRKREGGNQQTDVGVEKFRAKIGELSIETGLILVTKYRKGAHWNPTVLTSGQGILEVMSHTVSIRRNPQVALTVLNQVVERSVVVRCDRGEVERFSCRLLDYCDKIFEGDEK